jgi:CheY-like chemotaxis protein
VKLLIADDNATNLRLLRAQLEAEGHEVVDAANGMEGLHALRGGAFDGVISDILMPEMDGYRFCIEVRGDAALRELPFVLYTSTYNSPADRQLALSAGADAYIAKPAPVPVILQAITNAIDRRRGPAARSALGGESDVLKRYNEVLVRKLEDKNLDLEKSLERLKLAHEIDQAIIVASTPVQIAEAVLPRLRELLGMPRVVVNLIDLEKREAEWLAAIGRHRTHVGPHGSCRAQAPAGGSSPARVGRALVHGCAHDGG